MHAQQALLRNAIAQWAGWHAGDTDATNYKRFFYRFGVDVATALTLGAGEAEKLTAAINTDMEKYL
jgi:hypothetical protein